MLNNLQKYKDKEKIIKLEKILKLINSCDKVSSNNLELSDYFSDIEKLDELLNIDKFDTCSTLKQSFICSLRLGTDYDTPVMRKEILQCIVCSQKEFYENLLSIYLKKYELINKYKAFVKKSQSNNKNNKNNDFINLLTSLKIIIDSKNFEDILLVLEDEDITRLIIKLDEKYLYKLLQPNAIKNPKIFEKVNSSKTNKQIEIVFSKITEIELLQNIMSARKYFKIFKQILIYRHFTLLKKFKSDIFNSDIFNVLVKNNHNNSTNMSNLLITASNNTQFLKKIKELIGNNTGGTNNGFSILHKARLYQKTSILEFIKQKIPTLPNIIFTNNRYISNKSINSKKLTQNVPQKGCVIS